MKHCLLVLLNFLSFTDPSFAMLDDPFVITTDRYNKAKDLRPKAPDFRASDPRYDDRSPVDGNRYPKMVMFHPYTTCWHGTLCSGAPLKAYPRHTLEDYCAQYFPNHEKIYAFVLQSIDNPSSAVKPEYITFPAAPYQFEGTDYYQTVQWTVIPGGQGKLEPLAGNLEEKGLHSAYIATHNNEALGKMGVSDSVLSVKGWDPIFNLANSKKTDYCIPSKDAYSLILFEDEGRKIAAITYHIFYNTGFDTGQFSDVSSIKKAVKKANTPRELSHNLKSIPHFTNIADEFERFLGIAIDPELQPTGFSAKIETLPEKFIVTTDYNANASYQLRSNRFAVTTGQTVSVPYNITVAEGSKVSLGLLNTLGNGWYGNERVWGPGSYQGIFERIVPENETTAEVIFRNYHLDTPEQSIFTVNYATVKVNNQPVETQLTPTDSPMDISRKPGPMRVTTDHNANASYQLESKRFSVKAGEKICIPYDITVEDGGIMSLGLLNSLRTMWYPSQVGGETEELILKTGRHKGIFERIIPEGEAETSLVFRNYHLGTPGQTVFTITDLKIERGI